MSQDPRYEPEASDGNLTEPSPKASTGFASRIKDGAVITYQTSFYPLTYLPEYIDFIPSKAL